MFRRLRWRERCLLPPVINKFSLAPPPLFAMLCFGCVPNRLSCCRDLRLSQVPSLLLAGPASTYEFVKWYSEADSVVACYVSNSDMKSRSQTKNGGATSVSNKNEKRNTTTSRIRKEPGTMRKELKHSCDEEESFSNSDAPSSLAHSSAAEESVRTEPLKGRENEFNSLVSWVDDSIRLNRSLGVYVSGSPGTGKTATIKRVLQYFESRIESCIVNCASSSTKAALFRTIFDALELKEKPSLPNLQRAVEESGKSFVLVLDEIDHLATRSNSFLYSAFQWPYTISTRFIVIGIANSIDLTERILSKLVLTESPRRIIFEPYTKEQIVQILTAKREGLGISLNDKAIELNARKVAAMSGDLRTALHVFNQTKNSKGNTAEPSNGCREVLSVLNNVYSSPLARARLPLQPRLLLAVCLTLSVNKNSFLGKAALMTAYGKACEEVQVPPLDEEDLLAAFRTLESQSFIRQLSDGSLVLQVDAATARSAISDKSMLDQIAALKF
ncbi:unnamed protein product [Caenorhabditis auriculariae]|uniref:Cell division control protein n=1 Tax=Caenorhabditis auriculariae TaxID=2777116 RepID=A0A8S1GND9_9PELO|nr:unnamed protein product [Caenorhabditis auriculariae]